MSEFVAQNLMGTEDSGGEIEGETFIFRSNFRSVAGSKESGSRE